jgi:hypothetical protein
MTREVSAAYNPLKVSSGLYEVSLPLKGRRVSLYVPYDNLWFPNVAFVFSE